MELHEERRSDRRFRVCLPVMVTANAGRQISAHTRDISSRGIGLYLLHPYPLGSALQFWVTLPSDVTLSAPMRIKCVGRVVRVEENHLCTGIGAVIENYEFLAD
jgi:hypothetical protein